LPSANASWTACARPERPKKDNRPLAQKNPKAAEEEHRPITLITRDQATGLDSYREIGFGCDERILLSRRLAIERAERIRDGLSTIESDLDFELRRVGVRSRIKTPVR
jgi:hypothetical protein